MGLRESVEGACRDASIPVTTATGRPLFVIRWGDFSARATRVANLAFASATLQLDMVIF
jgi:hypothetical protein